MELAYQDFKQDYIEDFNKRAYWGKKMIDMALGFTVYGLAVNIETLRTGANPITGDSLCPEGENRCLAQGLIWAGVLIPGAIQAAQLRGIAKNISTTNYSGLANTVQNLKGLQQAGRNFGGQVNNAIKAIKHSDEVVALSRGLKSADGDWTPKGQALGYCFAAGTAIETKDGKEDIEDIEVGDVVLSRNDSTGEFGWKRVLQKFVTPKQALLSVVLATSIGNATTLEITPTHPIWANDQWVDAGDLEPGDAVYTLQGWAKVTNISENTETETVYNFEVEDHHTYFAGDIGVWAHNTGCALEPPSGKMVGEAVEWSNAKNLLDWEQDVFNHIMASRDSLHLNNLRVLGDTPLKEMLGIPKNIRRDIKMPEGIMQKHDKSWMAFEVKNSVERADAGHAILQFESLLAHAPSNMHLNRFELHVPINNIGFRDTNHRVVNGLLYWMDELVEVGGWPIKVFYTKMRAER